MTVKEYISLADKVNDISLDINTYLDGDGLSTYANVDSLLEAVDDILNDLTGVMDSLLGKVKLENIITGGK